MIENSTKAFLTGKLFEKSVKVLIGLVVIEERKGETVVLDVNTSV